MSVFLSAGLSDCRSYAYGNMLLEFAECIAFQIFMLLCGLPSKNTHVILSASHFSVLFLAHPFPI